MGAMIGGGPGSRKATGAEEGSGATRADAALLAGALIAGVAIEAFAALRRHAALDAAGPPPDPARAVRLVDLRTAGPAELGLLPGVGPRLAERIAAEREAHGPFEGLDDLARRVPGVGPVRTGWWAGRIAETAPPADAGGRR